MRFAAEERDGAYYNTLLGVKRLVAIIFYNGFNRIADSSDKKSTSGEENLVLKCHRYIIANQSKAVTVDELCSLCREAMSQY